MILYPAIEIMNGRCVSLHRGRLEEPEIWHVDPLAKAQAFADAGASWLHITDFDAVAGTGDNTAQIERIIVRAGAMVQLGGGFKTLDAMAYWIDRGVGRLVLGTIALMQPEIVRKAARMWPDQVVLAVDVWQGRVMAHGWREPCAIAPEQLISQFEDDALAAVIISDIDADLQEAEDALALVTRLAGYTRHPVIVRGLLHELDDLARMKFVPDISGAIAGRCLYDRSLDLKAALKLAAEPLERRAEFI